MLEDLGDRSVDPTGSGVLNREQREAFGKLQDLLDSSLLVDPGRIDETPHVDGAEAAEMDVGRPPSSLTLDPEVPHRRGRGPTGAHRGDDRARESIRAMQHVGEERDRLRVGEVKVVDHDDTVAIQTEGARQPLEHDDLTRVRSVGHPCRERRQGHRLFPRVT